jgi:2-hydroxychromene-2-carboxylate isomerase
MATLDFWFDFASSYSYPAAMRVEALAAPRGVALRWRPFLLGPIFAAQGWTTSPFNLYPDKGRYMWRDLARVCAKLSLPLKAPDPSPQNSLLAARAALAIGERRRAAFCRAVFHAEFGLGRRIDDRAVLQTLAADAGAPEAVDAAGGDGVKLALREETARARELRLFGAPSFVAPDGELFWGNDWLEDALDHCSGAG